MVSKKTTAVVLAAGMGKRMRSGIPKVMHKLAGRAIIEHVIASLESCGVDNIILVLGPELSDAKGKLSEYVCVTQRDRLGTGHAVKVALEQTSCVNNDIIVVCGDAPLLTPSTLRHLVSRQRHQTGLVLLAFYSDTPGPYGRVVNEGNKVKCIIEASEASAEQLKIKLCNSGVVMAPGRDLLRWLGLIDNKNSKGEFYLTDVVERAVDESYSCEFVRADEKELLGVNTKVDLAKAEVILQERYRMEAMINGVTLQDPSSTFLSFDTQLGEDVTVGPFTVFGIGVKVGNNVCIKGFCHFEGATIGDGSVVGPYARLRPGVETQENVHIGNFV
jgi:bifunctional UDP-N-acetylglucosamine pyrophosphorylase/glucosamine-1-phosphate N-acetyltransferase